MKTTDNLSSEDTDMDEHTDLVSPKNAVLMYTIAFAMILALAVYCVLQFS